MELLLSQRYIYALSNTILSPCLQGFSGTILLFALCFLGVHIAKVAVRGFTLYDGTKRENERENPPISQPKTEQKSSNSEPIYYIVEKKRRRSKYGYGDPKEFRFK